MARTEKDNFVFYHQWFEWLDELNGRQIKLILNAIKEYRLNGVEVNEIDFGRDKVAKQMAIVIVSCINSAEKKYEQVSEIRAENRRKKQNEQNETKITNDNKKNKSEQKKQNETKITNNNKTDIEKNRIEKNRIDNININIGENENFCESDENVFVEPIDEKKETYSFKFTYPPHKNEKNYEGEERTEIDYKNTGERFDKILDGIANSEEWQNDWLDPHEIPKGNKLQKIIEDFRLNNRTANEYSLKNFGDTSFRMALKKHLQSTILKKIDKETENKSIETKDTPLQRTIQRMKEANVI